MRAGGCTIDNLKKSLFQILHKGKYSISDFKIEGQIGQGETASVYKAKLMNDINDKNNYRYALKVFEKEKLVRLNICEEIILERKILCCMDCPFVARMYDSFQTFTFCIFALEYVENGTLANMIRREKGLQEEQVRFFSAQLFLGLEYLHNVYILHKDLRPENVVLTKTHQIKLIDFGKAALMTNFEKTKDYGQTEYMAPEVIRQENYDARADVWSFGVCMYEMLQASPPFSADSEVDLKIKILKHEIIYGDRFTEKLKDLIQSVLNRNKNLRSNLAQIKSHSWWRDMDWKALYEFKLEAPYKVQGEESNVCSNEKTLSECAFVEKMKTNRYKDYFENF